MGSEFAQRWAIARLNAWFERAWWERVQTRDMGQRARGVGGTNRVALFKRRALVKRLTPGDGAETVKYGWVCGEVT